MEEDPKLHDALTGTTDTGEVSKVSESPPESIETVNEKHADEKNDNEKNDDEKLKGEIHDDQKQDLLSGNEEAEGEPNGPDNGATGTDDVTSESGNLNNVDASDHMSKEDGQAEGNVELEGDVDSQQDTVGNESHSAEVHLKEGIDGIQNDSENTEVIKDESQSRNEDSLGNEGSKGIEEKQETEASQEVDECQPSEVSDKIQTAEESQDIGGGDQAPEESQEIAENKPESQQAENQEISENPVTEESEEIGESPVPEEKHGLTESHEDEEIPKLENSDEIVDEKANDESSLNEESQGNDSQANISTAAEGKDQEEDIQNPSFENAPEPLEQTQEDHSEALDPFDELLKGPSEAPAETSAARAELLADDDDVDDHHDAGDDVHEIDDEDIPAGDAEVEAGVEVVGEPGEDEEVCLLPDTEREISQADKEKALEASKLLQESAAASLQAKDEPSVEVSEETGEPAAEEHDAADHPDTTHEDTVNAEDKDKEGEETEATEPDESLPADVVQEIGPVDAACAQCSLERPCTFKLLRDGALLYLCDGTCAAAYCAAHPGYRLSRKKYLVEEIAPSLLTCSECEEDKLCYFYYNSDGEHTNYCSLTCLHSMMADEQHKYMYKRKRITIDEIEEKKATCYQCSNEKCTMEFQRYGETLFLCGPLCMKDLNASENGRYRLKKKKVVAAKKTNIPILKQPMLKLKVISNATDKYLDEGYKIQAKTPATAAAAREDRERSFIRKCVQCCSAVSGDEKNLSWETMDFCNETCLQRYQNIIGSKCANCKNSVNNTSLGKYCVRFGYDIRQFCCSTCLEEFKKGLKICCYCQRDISVGFEGFLAPVGDKGQFKDFCSQQCMGKFEQMSKNPIPQPVWAKCAVCSVEKPTQIEVGIDEAHSQRLCSDPCFAAFKFVNSIFPDQCRWCKKFFERKSECCFTIYTEMATHCFCTRACMNVYISNSRHIVPCNWCKVKKYNFDMIRRNLSSGQAVMMCSLNCLNLYQVSVNAVSSRRIKCDMCKRTSQAQYHLTMSDATVRNFCTYQCVMSFQGQYAKHGQPLMVGEQPQEAPKAVPTGAPRRTTVLPHRNNAAQQKQQQQQQQGRSSLPVISNVQSLAAPPPAPAAHATRGKSKRLQLQPPPEPEPPRAATPPPPPRPPTPPPPPPPKIYNHVLVKTLPPAEVANKATMTRPSAVSKGVSCRPHPCTKECQTDSSLERRVLIPIPVPIYVPVPIAMYSLPLPIPVPIPLPIPVPVFVPTTRNSAKGIMKEITKIHDKMPTDPFEAELLMMAEMVAGDKKKSESDSETDDENDEGFSPDAMDGGNAFGEDMLQMALKMASEYEEPPVDLESAMTASTITPSSHPGMPGLEGEAAMHHHHQMMVLEQQRAVAVLRASQAAAAPATRGKRAPPAAAAPSARAPRASKRRRQQEPAPPPPEPVREPAEKPDANMCLKYTFGVNAWKQWVMTKNAEIEKSSIRRKPFKSEILQLTADELNYSLCLFVKEVRKPNGSEYAPDTIYYLVLGIQQYLFENGRIDNIFTDPYYEKFTECLDEVARKFSVLYNDSQYIVTRVEEEHLWESKQLGAHSPHVLLSTLMFFNTKHFNLVTVEEHMQLSFSHIMKHWKRSPNQPGAAKMPGSRNVLLRFYPPQSALDANSRKKKVYEQQENEENPLRCPVKLYEFYISKCPESVRTRNDVFYLMPERSCVPDSPVWYSTQALGRDALAKMLHRVKMVKEINIALLTS